MPVFVQWLVRLITAVWCREVEVAGLSHVPTGRPLIVVANHLNGLIDPLLIAGSLPLRPRFLAKSTLWNNPVLRLFFALGRVVPVARRQDRGEGADMAQNAETFRVAAEVLRGGGVIALFPEGQSHNEPHLQPLKTGAARMALAGPDDVQILPVGIGFERKERFRSRALLQVGRPIDPAEARRMERDGDPAGAVRKLTAQIASGLLEVTVNVPTWKERRLIERAVEISLGDESSLRARTEVFRAFYDAYRWLGETRPEELAAVRREVARYDRMLTLLGLTDEEVRARYGAGSVVRWFSRFTRLVLLRLPLGVVGTLIHALPYQLPGMLARRKAKEPDQPASWKLFAAIVVFPVWWLVLAAAAASWLGAGWTAAGLALGPLSGWVALQWRESGVTLGEQARAFLLLPTRRRLLEEVRARRTTIERGLEELRRAWVAGDPRRGHGA